MQKYKVQKNKSTRLQKQKSREVQKYKCKKVQCCSISNGKLTLLVSSHKMNKACLFIKTF